MTYQLVHHSETVPFDERMLYHLSDEERLELLYSILKTLRAVVHQWPVSMLSLSVAAHNGLIINHVKTVGEFADLMQSPRRLSLLVNVGAKKLEEYNLAYDDVRRVFSSTAKPVFFSL